VLPERELGYLVAMVIRYFTPALFEFLHDLSENNDRAWFKANQERYEAVVRQPALAFIEDAGAPLYKVSRHLVADPRKVGGSLFRIQRDTRFARDKTPYKTHVGIHFRHVATREDVHAPGFYLHLEPRGSHAWLGLWHPSADRADAIRRAIVADPAAWKRAAYGKRFTEVHGALTGDSLTRPPRGFDATHPLIEDLKRIDFGAGVRLSQAEVTSAHFLDAYLATVRAGTPFMRFLCKALDLAF
jgi:uncharacterized protein (TIGR02453 family)